MLFKYFKNGKLIETNHPLDFDCSIQINNHRYIVKIKAKDDILLDEVKDVFKIKNLEGTEAFFNGYQSWTDSKEVKLNAKERNIYRSPNMVVKAYAMDKYGDAPFYKYAPYLLHGYDICYSKSHEGFFIYNLNYRTAYLLFEFNKRTSEMSIISDVRGIPMKKGEELTVMDYVFTYSYKEGLELFQNSFPKQNIKKVFGYSSWYNYYQNINEEIILHDLEGFDNRFNLFQIDDGYETFVGDWLEVDPVKFPNGLKPIVDKIHQKGMLAGIWLAPFVAESKSRLFNEHPEFFRKDKHGQPVKSGGNWSGQYALELEKPEVVKYIKDCLQYYMDLGFDFFKLDFLYASSLVLPEGYSRAQYQYKCYKLLRDILKDKIILGCGANLSSSIGNFDYLRIGPDVSLKWDDIAYMRMFHRERISTKVTLQNTIFRSILNDRWFGNDPDVFLLRDKNIEMNEDQKHSLALINSLFSSVLMTSDDISTYKKHQQKELEMVLDNFLHAKDISFNKENGQIKICYTLEDKKYVYYYEYKKGELTNG